MLLQHLTEMGRSCLFLAFEEELEIDGWRDVTGTQRIEGAEHRDDRALVVARGSRVDARLTAHALAGRRKRNHFRPGRQRPVAQYRCPRRARPLGWIDRLAVVVRVEHDRSRGAGSAQLAVDGRRPRIALERPRRHAAPAQELDHRRGVAADVDAVGRHVGYRQQRRELARDLRLVRLAKSAGSRSHVGARHGSAGGGCGLGRRVHCAERQRDDQRGRTDMPNVDVWHHASREWSVVSWSATRLVEAADRGLHPAPGWPQVRNRRFLRVTWDDNVMVGRTDAM